MKIKTWNIEEMTGYTPMYTFFEDFSIADMFGKEAIKGTYDVCVEQWKHDYKAMTELSMALNWKCWQHYEEGNDSWELYKYLYREMEDWAYDNLKGDELTYYINTTD